MQVPEETKPEEKKLTKWLKELAVPDYHVYVIAGMFMMLLGMTALAGGGIAVKATAESELSWINLSGSPRWLLWLIVWVGLDTLVFRSKATDWALGKIMLILKPIGKTVLESTVGEERLSAWGQKIEEIRKKLNASSQRRAE